MNTRILYAIVGISMIALFFGVYLILNEVPEAKPKTFETKTNEEGGVSISATPSYSPGMQLKFDITLTTHEGSMDFDMIQISSITDDLGNIYSPTGWEGSPPGGHHRSGTLIFPALPEKTKSIKLIIKNVYGIPERSLEWNIQG